MPTNSNDMFGYQFYARVKDNANDTYKKLAALLDAPTVTFTTEPWPCYYAKPVDGVSDSIRKVIFNNPATIILWEDGQKTVVKCQEGDEYDPLKGFLLCVLKKICGNNSSYNNLLRRFVYGEVCD